MQDKNKSNKIFAKEEDVYQLNIPEKERDLNTTSYDYSVQFLVSLMDKEKIVLEVPFQIWIWGQPSKLEIN